MLMIQRFFPFLMLGIITLAYVEPVPLHRIQELALPLLGIGIFFLGFYVRPKDITHTSTHPKTLALNVVGATLLSIVVYWFSSGPASVLGQQEWSLYENSASVLTSLILVLFLLSFLAKADIILTIITVIILYILGVITLLLLEQLSIIHASFLLTSYIAEVSLNLVLYCTVPLAVSWILKKHFSEITQKFHQYADPIILVAILFSLGSISAIISINKTLNESIYLLFGFFILFISMLIYLLLKLINITASKIRSTTIILTTIPFSLGLSTLSLAYNAALDFSSIAGVAVICASIVAAYWKWNIERHIKTARS